MVDWRRLASAPVKAGLLAVGAVILAMAVVPASLTESIRERVLDQTLAIAASVRPVSPPGQPIVVIDIDSMSLDAVGPWPWPREQLAKLVEAVGEAGASAVAIDILFEGVDGKSPAAVARRLGLEINRPDIVTLADTLVDGDKRLAESAGRFPVVLGFALDPDRAGAVRSIPFLVRSMPPIGDIWRSAGAVGPAAIFMQSSDGLGTLALPGDADGVVRRVPLLVAVSEQVHPGLSLEAIRLAQHASAYLLEADPPVIAVGEVRRALPQDGLLRLIPKPFDAEAPLVISASNVLENTSTDLLRAARGAIVFIGSSAPELGGLRPALSDPLTPSVIIQAAAVSQFLRGVVPRPVAHADLVEALMAAAAVVLGILAAAFMRPLSGAIAVFVVVAACWVAAIGAASVDRLMNPGPASALALAAFAATAFVSFAEAYRREARIRQRFEQHLAPQVVNLIASDPSLLKLRGQRREITALFTDVEGFTAMTHRAEPETMITVLDNYFEGLVKIIISHGGMIDKFVGDAVHAFFNAPLDLEDHPAQAVRCAIELRSWAESYQLRTLPASLQFGRTRIGIETGPAIVGDIGISSKLDYTAHGDAVNSAARFEAANKELGSTICVGPGTASRCDPGLLRPIGQITLRGFDSPVMAFEPWPADADAAWRSRYLQAVQLATSDAEAAASLFSALAAERPQDPVLLNYSSRLAQARQPARA